MFGWQEVDETVTLVSGAMHLITRAQQQLKFKSDFRYLCHKLPCVHQSWAPAT